MAQGGLPDSCWSTRTGTHDYSRSRVHALGGVLTLSRVHALGGVLTLSRVHMP